MSFISVDIKREAIDFIIFLSSNMSSDMDVLGR